MKPLTLWVIDDSDQNLEACGTLIVSDYSVSVAPPTIATADANWKALLDICHPTTDGFGWLVPLIRFERKQSAVSVLDDLFSATTSNDLPDIALIDVNFSSPSEEHEYFRSADGKTIFWREGNSSAHLGFPIAAKLQESAKRLNKPIVWALYTGNEHVESDYVALRSPLLFSTKGTVPPFIDIHTKVKGKDAFAAVIAQYVRHLRTILIQSGDWRPPLDVLRELAQKEWFVADLHDDDGALVEEDDDALRRRWLPTAYDLWLMFPTEAGRFFQLTNCKGAIEDILRECGPYDFNWALFCALKKVWVGSGQTKSRVALTPLAEAIHSGTYDEPQLSTWLRDASDVPRASRERIFAQKEALGSFEKWGRGLKDHGAPHRRSWTDSLVTRLKAVCGEFERAHHVAVRFEEGKVACDDMVLDWEHLFDEQRGLFRQYLDKCWDEQGSDFSARIFWAEPHVAEVVVTVRPWKHCGKPGGFRGDRLDERLFGYGESWYEATVEPPQLDGFAKFIRMDIWPRKSGLSADREDSDADRPVLELHWRFRNYLDKRTFSK